MEMIDIRADKGSWHPSILIGPGNDPPDNDHHHHHRDTNVQAEEGDIRNSQFERNPGEAQYLLINISRYSLNTRPQATCHWTQFNCSTVPSAGGGRGSRGKSELLSLLSGEEFGVK